MLSPKTRLMLQDILARLSRSEHVSLKERILVQKYADRNSTVYSWLRKARSIQREGHLEQGPMSGFMQNLNLAGQDTEDHFHRSSDDIGDWFQGSPGWVRRSCWPHPDHNRFPTFAQMSMVGSPNVTRPCLISFQHPLEKK